MGPHQFGIGRHHRIPTAARKQIREIAARHDCHWFYAQLPGLGLQWWFATKGSGMGSPYNEGITRAVFADLEQAGLLAAIRPGLVQLSD